MICCNYLRDPARVMNYRTGYLGRCEFTPSVLGVVAMADGVWGAAGTGAPGFAVTALAAGVAAAAGAGEDRQRQRDQPPTGDAHGCALNLHV